HNGHSDIHSFPTRRSSDLGNRGSGGLEASSLEAARRRHGEVHGEVATDKKESAMTWTQVYDPLHSWILSTLVAALPILVLFGMRSEEHTSELQSRGHLVCR